MKKIINWLFSAISISILLGNAGFVFAADNATTTDLQQLQALQQIPPTPPVRPNLQLNATATQTTTTTTQTAATAPTTIATTTPPTGTAVVGVTPGVQTTPPLPPGMTIPAQPPPPPLGPQAIVIQENPPTPAFQAPFTVAGNPMGDTEISQTAFNNMVNTVLPMTPDQIHRLKQLFTATQYAQAAPPGIPPRPVATSQIVNLAPGATPPVIRLAQGFVTSLVFIDSTGAPWPIESYSIGDPQRFNIQWNKVDNTLMIQAMSLYNYGNMAVRLKGLVTPVMLTLIPGQKDIDYRVDLRIQGLGPNAAPVLGECLPGSANPVLLGVLDGIPPPGSRELNVCGADFQVWLLGDKMFVRTHFTILSPAWRATMSSADGTKAYEMQKTPMLLISLHGKAVPVKIEGL